MQSALSKAGAAGKQQIVQALRAVPVVGNIFSLCQK